MARCVTFNDQISADILAAYKKSMTTKFILICRRSDGRMTQGTLKHDQPDGLRKLAAELNKQFPNRQYSVQKVEILELPIYKKAA